ncbi:hypothetical protein [Glycomyces sp. NPDC048151]|uniref:hypothetical protein n=1 Tax=Glycomyces sp. NPDC048151 TaxID=3364002 RepID=UPI003721CC6D
MSEAKVQRPSIGRDVHYVSYGTPGGEFGSECRAAKVTRVDDADAEVLSLAVFNPDGMFFNHEVPHDEAEKLGGSWHWPEWVE